MTERFLEVYSVLIPLAESRLLLPRTCVAEVVAYSTPVEMEDVPAWYLGTAQWNGRMIPLVSFEGMCAQALPVSSGRSRIVVMHALGGALEGGYFGLLAQGFPQVVRVTADVIRPDNSRALPERWPALCQVRMINETPLVPDIERIESMIAEETRVSA